jgi:hypothetical protein
MLLNNKKIIELFNELSAADINSLPELYKIHQTTNFNNSLIQKFKEVLIDNAVIEVECTDGLKHYFSDVNQPNNGVDFETSNVHLFLSQLGYPPEHRVGANLMLASKYNVEFDNFNTFVPEPGKVYIQKVCSNSKHPKVYEVAAIRVKYLYDSVKNDCDELKTATLCEQRTELAQDADNRNRTLIDKAKNIVKATALKRVAAWLADTNDTVMKRLYVYRGKRMTDSYSDERGNYSQRSWVTNSIIADSMQVDDNQVVFTAGAQKLTVDINDISNDFVVKKTGKAVWEDKDGPHRLELYLLRSDNENTPLEELNYNQVKEIVGLR